MILDLKDGKLQDSGKQEEGKTFHKLHVLGMNDDIPLRFHRFRFVVFGGKAGRGYGAFGFLEKALERFDPATTLAIWKELLLKPLRS